MKKKADMDSFIWTQINKQIDIVQKKNQTIPKQEI